jgi:hypothetical protein
MNHRYVNIVWAADMSLSRLEHALSIIYTNKGKGNSLEGNRRDSGVYFNVLRYHAVIC